MARIKKDDKKKGIVSFGIDEDMKHALSELSRGRNTTISSLGRIPLGNLLEDGYKEPTFMLHFVELTQQLNELQDVIPKNEYESIQKHIANIMKIKGGK